MTQPSIVNLAAYKFVDLTDLQPLRNELRNLCSAQQLRGTILLSTEGINFFVAGYRDGVDALLAFLRRVPGLAELPVKESYSHEQPFNRMLVKIKKEIIAFGVEGIAPAKYTSRRLPAQELKRWLDEGRPFTLLDTRNDFEVQAGTFRNAIAAGIDDFRDFPTAVAKLPAGLKDGPVVTFCTGGIRCEKAAPYLEREGFRDVYQLDGGILKYLEVCGGDHYDGQCFVFDKRVAVDASLSVGGLQQCFVCQAILSPAEQASPMYVEGQSCPKCYRSERESQEQLIARRHVAIARVTTPLPGSVPYHLARPINVPLRFDGMEVLDFFDAMKTYVSRDQWRDACAQGRIKCRGEVVLPGRIVRSGEKLLHHMPASVEPDVSADITVLHEDDALVVVNKPAPLPMHPCGRFNRNSLLYILNEAYYPTHLRLAHRLDADTTGVVVFTKTRDFARIVQPQFETGHVSKRYLARVHGHPAESEFECHAPLRVDSDQGGLRVPHAEGDASSTHFTLLEKFSDGTALLSVRPLTGRTNQIRAHLWELGLPIVGDPIYLRDRKLGVSKALAVGEPPLCLHAAAITFNHPQTRQPTTYEAAPPAWASSDYSSVL